MRAAVVSLVQTLGAKTQMWACHFVRGTDPSEHAFEGGARRSMRTPPYPRSLRISVPTTDSGSNKMPSSRSTPQTDRETPTSVVTSSGPKPSRSASRVGRCGWPYQSWNSSAPLSRKFGACSEMDSRYRGNRIFPTN